MAGFMSGFGTAFAQSFNQANERIAQNKSDLFKMKFQAEMSRKEKMDQIDRENEKAVKKAKSLVNLSGQPPELWSKVYEWVQSGVPDSIIQDKLTNEEATISPNSQASTDTSASVEPSQDLTAGAEGAVTAQMTQSGLTPPAPQEASLFGRLSNRPSREQQDNAEADAKVAEAMGDDPRALNATVQGASNPAIQGDVIPAASDYNVTWKKKVDPKTVLEMRLLELEVEAIKNPQLTPDQLEDNLLAREQLQLEIDKFESERNKPISVPENTDIISPDGKVIYKNSGKGPKASEVNSLDEAGAYKDWAYEFGTNEDKARADRMYETQFNIDISKAKHHAIENGTWRGDPFRAAIRDGENSFNGGTARPEVDHLGNTVWKHPDTGAILQPDDIKIYTPTMEKELDELAKDVAEPVADYNKRVVNFEQAVRTSANLSRLASQVPEALDISGIVTQNIDRWTRAGKNLLNITTGLVNPNDSEQNIVVDAKSLTMLGVAEKEAMSLLGTVQDISLVATIMDIQATRLAYMYAAAAGQEGRSVTQQEFQAFKENAMGRGNPEALTMSAKDFITNEYKVLQTLDKNINKNSMSVRKFEERHNIPSPFQPAQPIEDIIGADPELEDAMEFFTNDSNDQAKRLSVPVPDVIPMNAPERGRWDSLSDRGRELALKKYQKQGVQ